MSKAMAVIIMVALVLLFAAVGPWILFWSINELFHYQIPYTWGTWFAGILLMALVGRGSK